MKTVVHRQEKTAPQGSSVALLLMDSSLKPIFASAEAMRILAYPDNPQKVRSLGRLVGDKIRSHLLNKAPSGSNPSLKEFPSGKRRYQCSAFSIDFYPNNIHQPAVALLIERNHRGLREVLHMAQQFHLTQRERKTVEFLMHGLTSKEIANQMKISPNTVKAFLRLIMIKLDVSTRSGIIGKIMGTHP